MPQVSGNPFALDWTDLETVKDFARKLGSSEFPMTVFKRAERPNYNITFTSRTDTYRREEAVFDTHP